MSRIQLALNVADLESAVDYYSKLFDTVPAKVRPGYANFAIADPPLKLVLIENRGSSEPLNHLGVEVESPDEVVRAQERLVANGLRTTDDSGTCCYADQAKVWVDGPGGEQAWEFYAVLDDAEEMGVGAASVCCASGPELIQLGSRERVS
jgi:lactoylglutathione lyase